MMEKPEILLMFSGGLDSTAVFLQLLKRDRKIHVHHMNLRNAEKRARAEAPAVRNILKYMRNEIGKSVRGDFIYSESTHEYPVYNDRFMWDSDIVSFMAGSICLSNPWIKYVALGFTKSDSNPGIGIRVERANKILGAFSANVTKIYPVRDLTKKQIFYAMPEDLRNLTWSCRMPKYIDGIAIPCDKCPTCEDIRNLHEQPTPNN